MAELRFAVMSRKFLRSEHILASRHGAIFDVVRVVIREHGQLAIDLDRVFVATPVKHDSPAKPDHARLDQHRVGP
jgi:hypothetical protein